VGPRRSTGGSTSSSTGIRPIVATCGTNCGVSVGIPRTGRTITSSIWRRIRMDTAGLEGAGCPSKSRSYEWGRRRNLVVTLFSAGRQRVTSRRSQDPPDFCRKTAADIDAEVYRNSTGSSVIGKSAGKERSPRDT
jgi:hypothetical protein